MSESRIDLGKTVAGNTGNYYHTSHHNLARMRDYLYMK